MADKQKFEDDIESHDYDGIKELNNKAPAWIIFIFYATIGFSLLYLIHYFGYPGNGKDQASEYDSTIVQHQRELALKKETANEHVVTLTQAEIIEKGKLIYAEKGCVGCHGNAGQGASGPNLADNFWIHGCSQESVQKIITEGNPVKGMLAYKSMLTEDEISQVSTYVLQEMVGSNPEGGIEPKGEECK